MSELTIPYEKIISLWFDGLELEPGKEFPMAAMRRWFMATEEFDAKCRYCSPFLTVLTVANMMVYFVNWLLFPSTK